MDTFSANCDSKPAVLNAQELAEAIAASYPVLVVDPVQDEVVYQNNICRALFGELGSFADLEARRETRADDLHPDLKSVYRLRTSRGVYPYMLHSIEQAGRVVQVLKDVSDLETELEELYRGLSIDPLSKALNRRSMMYALVQEISRAERSAENCQLLLVSIEELDRLEIKDSVDQVVVRVAELIQSTIRQTDILGRLDHAAYALLLPATDHEGGIWVAQRTWRLIEVAPPQVQGVALPTSVSIGMSGFRHGDTPQALIARAQEGRLHVVRVDSGD